MITLYLFVVVFVMGMFVGSAIEGKDKPSPSDWCVLVLLAVWWPFLIYIYWKEWSAKP